MPNIISITVNGYSYSGFKNVSINKNIAEFAHSFSISFIQNDEYEKPILLQDLIEIFIDDNLVLTGIVEELQNTADSSGSTWTANGRSKTADLIDSTAIRKTYKQKNFYLLFKNILKDNGFSSFLVSLADKKTLLKKLDTDTIIDNMETKVYDVLDNITKKAQLLITTNTSGNIYLTKEGDIRLNAGLYFEKKSDRNNILSKQLSLETTERYNSIKIVSTFEDDDDNAITQIGTAIDKEIRSTRKLVINEKQNNKASNLTKIANWYLNVKKAKGSQYTCKVAGFYNQVGELYKENTRIELVDDYLSINGTFLIQAVNYNVNDNSCYTELTLVELGTFTLDTSFFDKIKIDRLGKNLIRL